MIVTEGLLKEKFKKLPRECHKGDNGFLNVIAGSEKYRGAADLCVGAALRTGVGIVRLISSEAVIQAVASRHPTCTFLPTEKPSAEALAINGRCFLIGCGIGISNESARAVATVLSVAQRAVLDADALNIASQYPKYKEMLNGHIITPHIGEFSRLTGLNSAEIKASPEKYALEFAKNYGCTVVLKDYVTVIAAPSGKAYISDNASEGLSKGGSGDVLAGLVAGFLAQDYCAEDAAVIGVAVHALASQLCAKEMGVRSMLPSDLEIYVAKLFVSLGY